MTTMQDIADFVGVSRSTVSFALNGRKLKNGDIPAETRERIIATAEKLGYKRNELASSVRRGYSKTIAYLLGGTGCYSFSLPMIIGASAAIQARGFYFKLSTPNRELDMHAVLSECVGQMVAGVIGDNIQREALAMLQRELEPRGIPVVLADNSIPHDWCISVTSDEIGGAEAATAHLLALGHRRIGLISYGMPKRPDLINPDPANSLRREGFFRALAEAGTPHDPHLEMRDSEPDGKKVPEIARFLKESSPTAVFCVTDYLAADTLHAACLLGLRVPQDLSVVGYGNLEIARYNNPPLTSIMQPFEEIGAQAANALLDRIANGKSRPPDNVVLPVRLIQRESTSALSIKERKK